MSETSDPELPAHNRATAASAGAREPSDLAQDVGTLDPATATLPARTASQTETDLAIRAERERHAFAAFDSLNPPRQDLIDDCTHCGFCLPTCPTYLLYGEEMDSPRGRVYLMQEGLEGEPLNDSMARHFDLCLGCLACVTACPSHVQYDKLIVATRQQVERRYPRSFWDRFYRELIYSVLPYPRRLQLLALPWKLYQRLVSQRIHHSVVQRLPVRMQSMEQLIPVAPTRPAPVPTTVPSEGVERRRVGMLLGCVQRVYFSDVNEATARVLAAEGCTVVTPSTQGCCGALSEHVGREDEALKFARRMIDVFESAEVDAIVVNVAGCGSMMKGFADLFRDDPVYAERANRFAEKIRDVSEFLAALDPVAARYPLPMSVVYHDACHLAHGQQIREQPRVLLAQIPELEVREVPREREICCGSAGTYNLFEPEAGMALGDRKAANVFDAGADLLVTGNPGCHLQIQAGLKRQGKVLPALHLVQVLDASIRAQAPQTLLDKSRGAA